MNDNCKRESIALFFLFLILDFTIVCLVLNHSYIYVFMRDINPSKLKRKPL